MVAYNDAAAHLNTARRMIDNLTPGVVQIGSVWLPLLHLAELPFVANFWMWKTGLAGAAVSSISFILGTFFLYKLSYYITKNNWIAFFACLLYITNVNLLYVQTTAMFEPLLMGLAITAIYFMTRWAKERAINDLILSAFFIMLATLTRYDGWALFLASIVFVAFTSFFIIKKKAEGSLIIFIFLAGFGICLWLLYNGLIFGDPLFFSRSEYSAAAQQEILYERGQLATKKDIFLSFQTYSIAMILNIGYIVVGLMVVGILLYILGEWKQAGFLAPLLLTIPYAFNIVSLYMGQSVIWLPMVPPHFDTYFNARYGILMLPAAAFFGGYIARYRIGRIAIVVLLAIQIFLFAHPKQHVVFGKEIGIITLQDTVSSINAQTVAASTYLREHHDGKLIMVSSASADAFIFRAALPLRYFITEGTGYYWRNSLEDPRRHAGWIVFFQDKSDRVGKVVSTSPILKDHYENVYNDTTYQIWKLKPST